MKKVTMVALAAGAAGLLWWFQRNRNTIKISGLNANSQSIGGQVAATAAAEALKASPVPSLNNVHPRDAWGMALINAARANGYRFEAPPVICELNTKENGPKCNYDNPGHMAFMRLVKQSGSYWNTAFDPVLGKVVR
jgi:hypothetical protein